MASKAEIRAEMIKRGLLDETKETKGLRGIQSDVEESLGGALPALGEMIKSVPGGINKVGHYATTNNPVSTLANLGAGGVESAAGLLSSPQKLMRYLAEKFPGMNEMLERGKFHGQGVNDPTIYEGLMNAEQKYGMAPQNEEEAAVRNAGGLLFGGGALTKLPNMASRMGAVSAEQGGRGGDPLHAALFSMLGETTARAPWKKAPAAVKNMVASIPELKANMAQGFPNSVGYGLRSMGDFGGAVAKKAGSSLESALADMLEKLAEGTNKAHVPIFPEKLLEKAYKMKYRTQNPTEFAKKNLLSDISEADLPKIEERDAAAKRLGLSYLTPAELVKSPFEAKKQGRVGRTSAGSKALIEKGGERLDSEATAINTFLNNVFNEEKLNPEMEAAYRQVMESDVTPEFMERHLADPDIQDAIHKINSTSALRKTYGDTPTTSFEYWNLIKRILGEKEEKLKEDFGVDNTEAGIIGKTRKQMVREMDEIDPQYSHARKLSERDITRRKIEKFFDKRKLTGNNFFKYIESKKNFDMLMHKLEPFPEAQQNLRDMQLLFEDLIPSKVSLRSAAALDKTGMSRARNELDALKDALNEKYGQEHDVAAVNLITNPDLARLIAEHVKNR